MCYGKCLPTAAIMEGATVSEISARVQKEVFTNWINYYLKDGFLIKDLFEDLSDGRVLHRLLEILSKEKLRKVNTGNKRIHRLSNVNVCLTFLRKKISLEGVADVEDIVDCKHRPILRLVYEIISVFKISQIKVFIDAQNNQGATKSGLEALLLWYQRKTNEYKIISIKNFTSSWKDGLALNGLIHSQKPQIKFDNLLPSAYEYNVLRAMKNAEVHFGIPKLFNPKDIGNSQYIDERAMHAYISFFYHAFTASASDARNTSQCAGGVVHEQIKTHLRICISGDKLRRTTRILYEDTIIQNEWSKFARTLSVPELTIKNLRQDLHLSKLKHDDIIVEVMGLWVAAYVDDANATELVRIMENAFGNIAVCEKLRMEFNFSRERPRIASSLSQLTLNNSEELEINILLLGGTGVGKSTFINNFASAFEHDTLEEAKNSELIIKIPTQFSIFLDGTLDEIQVNTGCDRNECFIDGESATQTAHVYPFQISGIKVNLIDTPGIGDTRGKLYDQKNLQNILTTISHLNELHGICILLKPNDSKLNLTFRYCIKELLTYLHREASKNIIFCFTHTRATGYTPGDTFKPLKALLNQTRQVDIPLVEKNVYCWDSEGYRFLASIHNNPPVHFPEDEIRSFSKSWDKTREEIVRMIQYILGLLPHDINGTVVLNNARECVLKLARPLTENTRNIQINKAIIAKNLEEIQKMGVGKSLKKNLKIPKMEIQIKRIDHPKLVCTHKNCVSVKPGKNFQKTIEYPTICEQICQLPAFPPDCILKAELMRSPIMKDNVCIRCKHRYEDHMYLYYDSFQVQTEVEDLSLTQDLIKQLTASEMKQRMIEFRKSLIQEYEDESLQIQDALAQFGCFLKRNAITPYNDAMDQYLEYLIQEEEDKRNYLGQRYSETLENLKRSREAYHEKRMTFDELSNGKDFSADMLTPEKITALIERLKGLKHSGKALKEAIICVDHTRDVQFKENVVKEVEQVKQKGNFLSRWWNNFTKK